MESPFSPRLFRKMPLSKFLYLWDTTGHYDVEINDGRTSVDFGYDWPNSLCHSPSIPKLHQNSGALLVQVTDTQLPHRTFLGLPGIQFRSLIDDRQCSIAATN